LWLTETRDMKTRLRRQSLRLLGYRGLGQTFENFTTFRAESFVIFTSLAQIPSSLRRLNQLHLFGDTQWENLNACQNRQNQTETKKMFISQLCMWTALFSLN
jgi:hypothetical protein